MDDAIGRASTGSRSSLASVAGLITFVHRQLTVERPVVDLPVLRHRSLWEGSLLSVVVGMALYGALFAVPIFAQTIMKYTPQQTGLLLLRPGALSSASPYLRPYSRNARRFTAPCWWRSW